MDKVFKNYNIEAVIHFAANSLVGESMEKHFDYYHNNVYGRSTGTVLALLFVQKDGIGRHSLKNGEIMSKEIN